MAGTGSLAVNGGTMDLIADFSTVLTSVTINGGGRLFVDNPQSNKSDRFNNTMPLTMGTGTFEFSGRSSNDSSETLGALTVANGVGVIKINPNGATSTSLTLASYTRGAGGYVAFSAATGVLGGTSTIKFTTAPTLVNGIINYACLDADLATYDATNGVVAATYQSTTLAGILAATDNVKISANETLLVNKTLNALAVAAPGGTYGNGINLGGKTLTIASGNLVLGNDLNMMTNGTIAFGSAEGYIYARSRNFIETNITGTGGVTYGGQVTLNGGNRTYSGPTRIEGEFTLGLANSDKIPDASALTLVAGGSLIQDGRLNYNETIGSLAGAGTVNITPNTGNAMTLFAGGDNTSTTFSGGMNGTFSFTKQGTGTFTYSGTGTTTGTTTVSTGKMVVNGSLAAGATVVASGATLGGSGTLGALNVSTGGTLAPGNSPGNLTVTNGLTVAGIYSWDLAALSTANPGTNFDTVTITVGNVDITGAALSLNLGAFAPTNIPFWQVNQTWAGILNNTGTGTLTGSFAAIGNIAWASLGGFTTTTTGNDVNLVWTAIPEPGSALLGGLGMLALLRRRRA